MPDAESDQVNPSKLMINGPINVIRLEGEINGIHKVIYLFMDYHASVASQTQCANIFSHDVQKFFTESFYQLSTKNSDITYDFFVEIYPSELAVKPNRRRDRKEKYIEEVVKVFQKIFKFDHRKNKVGTNKLFRNIRLHYLDVRDYYKSVIHRDVSEMVDIARKFMSRDYIDIKGLTRIITLLELLKTHVELVIDVLLDNKTKPAATKIIKKREKHIDINALHYLSKKLQQSYKHSQVRKVMHILLKETIQNLRSTIDNVNAAIKTFSTYLTRLEANQNKVINDLHTGLALSYGISAFTLREMIVDIMNTVDKIFDENFIEFFARFTDIYFLRRFLDKDYITNAVVYTGALHSNMYVHVLVAYFDFKITNASYLSGSNLKKVNASIKNKSLTDIQQIIMPSHFIQCSDMTGFPKDFA